MRGRQQAAMASVGLDALVAVSVDNVAYGAGYVVPSQALGMRHRQFAVLATRDGDSAMLLTTNEVDEARERSPITSLVGYDEFTEDPMQVLGEMLRERGLSGARIGVELDVLPAVRWTSLRTALPDARFEPAAAAFDRARMIKTPAEVAHLREAAAIAMDAQLDAHAAFRAGMTEHEAYRLLADRALARGADKIVMIQVAAGTRSTLSNPSPGPTPFEDGRAVKVDVFVSRQGYLSDTGRSVVIGRSTPRQRDTWARMNDVMDLIRDEVRPGTATGQLWTLFVREFGRRGLAPAIRFLGHGLGLSLHEEPYIAAHADTLLEPGMVFAVEPIGIDEGNGYHLEDILLVTEDGHENLTPRFPRELVVC
ncbi:M24 family metallopeptidase [Pseudonocardia sp.]|uniref:M24 family metallopeptidase n=1 Tax=Pseudonocardia sp. TaxID=60912 RepID=UPI003D0DB49D